jgi:lysozyme
MRCAATSCAWGEERLGQSEPSEARNHHAMLQDHYGRRPVLYMDVVFDTTYLRGHFTRETFWTRSIVLPPWFRIDQWLIWQYHSCGRRAGISGLVDLNAFRGSRRALEAFVAGEPARR